MEKKIKSMKVQKRAVAKVTVPSGQEFNLELQKEEEKDIQTKEIIEEYEEQCEDSEIHLKIQQSFGF